MVSVEVLRALPYFAGVGGESLRVVAAAAEERLFQPGDPLFHEGDPARALYIIREGQIDIVYRLQEDDGRVVDTVVAGDLIGWSSLVEPFRCTATAVPRTVGRAVCMEGTALRGFCERDYSLGYQLFKALTATLSRRLQGALVQLAAGG